MIPLCIPYIGEEEIKAVAEVLHSGWVAHGPKNEELEREFAKYLGVKHALTFNSCTSVLQVAIRASGLKGEIIVPSFTFVASANAILNEGCKPVFADIEYDTCNIDPSKIKDKITDKTEGIMPVHFAGQSCRMDEIMEIAEKHDLVVIEDSAEAIGAEYKGKKTGTFGIGCFSFWATKNMTTGEGGMLATNDDGLAERATELRGHGNPTTTLERDGMKMSWKRDCVVPGYNFRMSNIMAAIGLVQLKKLDNMNALRMEHANYYDKHLDFDAIEKPVALKECKHVYQMYTMKVKNVDRDEFVFRLREKGVGASVHFDPPAHLCTYYQNDYRDERLPVTEGVAKSIVTLPLYPLITKEELDEVISAVKDTLSDYHA
jgi:perosamine synthetase